MKWETNGLWKAVQKKTIWYHINGIPVWFIFHVCITLCKGYSEKITEKVLWFGFVLISQTLKMLYVLYGCVWTLKNWIKIQPKDGFNILLF